MKFGFRAWPLLCGAIVSLLLPLYAQQPKPSDSELEQDLSRGRQALLAGKYDEAIKTFKQANKRQKNSCVECYLGMAVAYSWLGDENQVIESSNKALSCTTDDTAKATAHDLKGKALLILGTNDPKRYGEAEVEFRTAAKLEPAVAQVYMDLSLSLLRQSKDTEAVQELQKCLELNPPPSIAEQAKKIIAQPKLGRMTLAPQFHLVTVQGQEMSLQGLAGKTVVLDFWATWCPPCRASVPELKRLTAQYPSDRLAVISISADDDEKAWQAFIAKKGMEWPQFRDGDGKIRNAFSVRAFPTYVVIDGDGAIREQIVGMDPQQTIVYRLRDLLATLPALQAEKK